MAKDYTHHMEKRGKVWYFIAMVNGKRYHQQLSTSVKEAVKLRDDFLAEISYIGDIRQPVPQQENIPFGEVAEKWGLIKSKSVKQSTWRGYRSTVNGHILPYFGDMPINNILPVDVENFRANLEVGAKTKNNILIQLRDIFDLAFKNGYVKENIMLKVDNLRVDSGDIFPLSISEVKAFLDCVHTDYRNFFAVAFYTGMRFGEMASLKWQNVLFDKKLLNIVETRVYGVEDVPKTKKSKRHVDLLKPATEALRSQWQLKRDDFYVFHDKEGRLMTPDHVREVIWKPALVKAGIKYRPMAQTRHTFATLMINAGEKLGWVQNQLGHASLQMIYQHYYAWIPDSSKNDGNAFIEKMYEPEYSKETSLTAA
ncbi:MAG: site-specific integrase [Desulfobulbaceae bacterium]|nr:site-specific integrase [Desulfobulbaceae bacterium]